MNTYAYLVVGLLTLGVIGGGAYMLNAGSGAPTGQIVKEAYDLATNSDLEIMKVEDDGSLDRVVMSDGEGVITTYVTEDGKYLVNNPVDLENYTSTLRNRNDFLSCLREEDAQFFGIFGSQDEQLAQYNQFTQAQFQVLGGSNGLNNIFAGPGEGEIQQAVLENGIVWAFGEDVQAGIQTVPQLEDATGCTFEQP